MLKIIIIFAIFCLNIPVYGQNSIDVSTRISPPLVNHQNNQYSGYSIDVWEEVAKRNNYQTNWVLKNTVDELLSSVSNKEVDLAIASISVTAKRSDSLDFSHPYLDSGLQIVSHKKAFSFFDLFKIFWNSGAIKILLVGLILILIVAHIFWLSKVWRGSENTNYFLGIWEGFWWSSVGLLQVDYGGERPKSKRGQLILIGWLLLCLIFLAQLDAVVTAQYTIDKLGSKVSTISDLLDIPVGVVKDSTADTYAKNQNIQTVEYPNAQEMLDSVSAGVIKAGISDVPIVQYYKSHKGQKTVDLGDILKTDSYAIALPLDSDLRRQINKTLLTMEEDGTLSRIQEKWFP
jgi:polar amino acid transport system substrate-binding protein